MEASIQRVGCNFASFLKHFSTSVHKPSRSSAISSSPNCCFFSKPAVSIWYRRSTLCWDLRRMVHIIYHWSEQSEGWRCKKNPLVFTGGQATLSIVRRQGVRKPIDASGNIQKPTLVLSSSLHYPGHSAGQVAAGWLCIPL